MGNPFHFSKINTPVFLRNTGVLIFYLCLKLDSIFRQPLGK